MRPYIRQAVTTVTASVLVLGATMTWGVENAESPYGDIVVRNAFGLKPPEPPKAPEPPAEEVAPSNIIMTGLTSINGKKQVYLKLTTPGEKEPKYIHLGENEREGAIEVVEITPKTGRVRIKNRGLPSLISFETHGAQMAAAPSVPAVNGRPGVPGMPAVPGAPSAPVSANNSVTAKPITSTLPVSPNNSAINPGSVRPNGNSNLPSSQPGVVNPGTSGSNQSAPTRTIPSRPLRLNPSGGGASYVAPSNPEIHPVAQVIGMAATDAAAPGGPPLPPIP